jgi:hypothetical protein
MLPNLPLSVIQQPVLPLNVSVQQQHVLLLLDEPVLHVLQPCCPNTYLFFRNVSCASGGICSTASCSARGVSGIRGILWKPVLPLDLSALQQTVLPGSVLYVLQQTVLSSHVSIVLPLYVSGSTAACAFTERACSTAACAAPGRICFTAVCAAPDMSILQKSVMPLDVSVQ